MAMIGAVLAPVGLWWFAWYVYPSSKLITSLTKKKNSKPFNPFSRCRCDVLCFRCTRALIYNRTSKPSIHWIVPIVAGIPFGIGVAQILQSLTAYLMDTYNVYFASAIAATVVLRSICGAAFPLFSPSLFEALGDQWAMSVFAALSTVCMPIPLLFWVCLSKDDRDHSLRLIDLTFVEIWVVDSEQISCGVQRQRSTGATRLSVKSNR
jgi:hypothetical protein